MGVRRTEVKKFYKEECRNDGQQMHPRAQRVQTEVNKTAFCSCVYEWALRVRQPLKPIMSAAKREIEANLAQDGGRR